MRMTAESQFAFLLMIFLLPGLFMLAGFYDVLTTRIPDWISITLVAGFVIWALAAGLGMWAFAAHAGVALLVFFAGFAAFSLGWMGGGDGKLAAAGALWFGPSLTLEFITLSFIYGALMVFVMTFLRRVPLPVPVLRQAWLMQWVNGSEGLPFGLAMAAGVLTVLRFDM